MLKFEALPSDNLSSSKFFYFIEAVTHGDAFKTKSAVLDWFTMHEHPEVVMPTNLVGEKLIRVTSTQGEVRLLDNWHVVNVRSSKTASINATNTASIGPVSMPKAGDKLYGILRIPENNTMILVYLTDKIDDAPFRMWEQFYISKGMIKNYNGDKLKTDVGKFYVNQLLLVDPFGDLIPYHNARFKPGDIDDEVAKLILDNRVGRKEFNTYMNNGYWFCEDGTLSIHTWSEKSLTTDPQIAIRKKELLTKYHDQIKENPVIATKIEKELIEMDKEWLKGDPSAPFYEAEGGKVWSEQRKKMYVMFGLATPFAKNKTAYEFAPESLTDGWSLKNLDIMGNDVRRGSYDRGKETAKGGEQTKFVLRIFQEISADEDDCGSKEGIHTILTEDKAKEFMGRYLVDGTILDENSIPKYLNKPVVIRSPLFCKSKPGFCYKCCGSIFEKLDLKRIGMQALLISSGFTSSAMSSMHASSVKSTHLANLKRFFRYTKTGK